MDILNLAMEMEKEGEEFYLEQEISNENYGLKAVCSLLAKEEAKHRDIIESRISGGSFEFKDGDLQKCIKEIYPKDGQFQIEIKAHPEQFDFYRLAMEKEQKSLELYKSLLEKTDDEEVKKLLLFLISQEEKHYDLFDEMSQMLRHAEEWVEAPEFGLRKEEY